jgi:hypothetical protein
MTPTGYQDECGFFTEDMNERRISGVSEPQACNATSRTGTGSSADSATHSSTVSRRVWGAIKIVLCVIGGVALGSKRRSHC